jgi:hypothetical protein
MHTWPWAARPEARPEKLGPGPRNVGPTAGPGRAWVARKHHLTVRPSPRPDGLGGYLAGPGRAWAVFSRVGLTSGRPGPTHAQL